MTRHGLCTFVLVATLVSACQEGCGSSGTPATPDDVSTDASEPVDAGVDASPADASPCYGENPTYGIPTDVVPEGWVRTPCVPVGCDIYIAPHASLARPPSPWQSCGEGCLELVHDWGDPRYRLFGELGASQGSVRFIGYVRDLYDMLEIQIVRVPDNVVTFDALRVDGMNSSCSMGLRALSPAQTELDVSIDTSDIWVDRVLDMTMAAGEAMPRVIFDHTDSTFPLETVVTNELWAVTYGGWALYWHGLEPANEMQVGWESPDGRMLHTLSAAGSTVLFSTVLFGVDYALLAWDATEGARTLVSFPDIEQGGACCGFTDGIDMVWYEGSGFDAETETFSQVDLWTSPFATRPEELQPQRLRTVGQDFLNDAVGVVGGGYALHAQRMQGQGTQKDWILTRLSDGAYWMLEGRPGFHWNVPLYVDEEELALSEGAGGEVFSDAGLRSGESYTIVRRTIASLGEPTLPE